MLEVGAGSGHLARHLREALRRCDDSGAAALKVVATDAGLWGLARQGDASVERMSYRVALEKYQPDIVLCAWMPLGDVGVVYWGDLASLSF